MEAPVLSASLTKPLRSFMRMTSSAEFVSKISATPPELMPMLSFCLICSRRTGGRPLPVSASCEEMAFTGHETHMLHQDVGGSRDGPDPAQIVAEERQPQRHVRRDPSEVEAHVVLHGVHWIHEHDLK